MNCELTSWYYQQTVVLKLYLYVKRQQSYHCSGTSRLVVPPVRFSSVNCRQLGFPGCGSTNLERSTGWCDVCCVVSTFHQQLKLISFWCHSTAVSWILHNLCLLFQHSLFYLGHSYSRIDLLHLVVAEAGGHARNKMTLNVDLDLTKANSDIRHKC